MQDTNRVSQIHPDNVEIYDKGIAPEERSILATVPSRVSGEENRANDLHPETYRQALKVMLGTPEIESRLDYITAGMIVTIFGGWLAGKAIKSRAFAVITDLLFLFLVAALIGGLLGVLLGEAFLPASIIPFFLLAMAAAMLFLLGILVGSTTLWQHPDDQKQPYQWASHARERRSLTSRRKP